MCPVCAARGMPGTCATRRTAGVTFHHVSSSPVIDMYVPLYRTFGQAVAVLDCTSTSAGRLRHPLLALIPFWNHSSHISNLLIFPCPHRFYRLTKASGLPSHITDCLISEINKYAVNVPLTFALTPHITRLTRNILRH